MRCASAWALVLVLGFSASAWAQFGGGGFGGGEMMDGGMGVPGGGMGMGMGYEMGVAEANKGIAAYRTAPAEAGRFQVTWIGTSAAESQNIAAVVKGEETKMQFVDTPLIEVVEFLKNLHDFPIVIDQVGLNRSAIDVDAPINAYFSSLTLQAALELLTKQHDLGWYIDGGALVVTSQNEARQHQSVRIYKLAKLDAVGAAEVVEKIAQPGSWAEQGGEAEIAIIRDRNLLVIRQNREGHEAVEALLTQLEELK